MKRGLLGVPLRVAQAVAACLLMAACATPVAPPPPELFRDARFGRPVQPVDPDDAFALSDEMRRYVDKELHMGFRERPGPQRLVDALNQRAGLKLEYDAVQTRNAAQAFADRRGNCLSLVLMTAALAKAMRLEVNYQYVQTDEVWSHSGDIAFLNVHVNLTLGRRAVDTLRGYDPARLLTVDFLPADEILGQRTSPISEETIVAMYMNNRAAEALAKGRVDDAYWWARGAVVRAPDFAAAYNTLGVVYLRHGDLDAAELALGRAIRRNPRDRQAISNLALVYSAQGRGAQAAAMRVRLAQLEEVAPYRDYLLGMEAMRRGDYTEARADFAKEVERDGDNSEMRFWLGVANLKLGNVDEARHQISLALASSTSVADRDLYAAKLEHLRSAGMH
jgi:Flp pilus assembly protein TadD